jgi:D-glycero-alpha-D-manno-heptose-7-phosphate kinase
MIISRTPFRISFFGGGTDYPAWYEKHGGCVLSTSFDKYSYITCRNLPPFFDHKYRIAYSKVENARDLKDIENRAVRAVIEYLAIDKGLEIHADADLPARSGLGSSSSFVVGLLNSLNALNGEYVNKEYLANTAIHIERNLLEETVGSQDQIAASYGGFNKIVFNLDGSYFVEPIIINSERKSDLESHLMLFFTGFSRIASEIAKSKVANMSLKQKELTEISSMVGEALSILTTQRDIRLFGDLLNHAWALKRSLTEEISNNDIDLIYERAIRAGALGGKLLGAGGGGFLLMFVEPDKQYAVHQALSNLIRVPFKFENTGSQIIYYNP